MQQLYKVEDIDGDIRVTEQRKNYELYRKKEQEYDLEGLPEFKAYEEQKQKPLAISTLTRNDNISLFRNITKLFPFSNKL